MLITKISLSAISCLPWTREGCSGFLALSSNFFKSKVSFSQWERSSRRCRSKIGSPAISSPARLSLWFWTLCADMVWDDLCVWERRALGGKGLWLCLGSQELKPRLRASWLSGNYRGEEEWGGAGLWMPEFSLGPDAQHTSNFKTFRTWITLDNHYI